jgi:hypothetical protein
MNDTLDLRTLAEDRPAAEKEIKVRLPTSYHVKLHTIKVLHGPTISEQVREALDLWFARLEGQRSAAREQRTLRAWLEAPPERRHP